jgi:hypothetical protein
MARGLPRRPRPLDGAAAAAPTPSPRSYANYGVSESIQAILNTLFDGLQKLEVRGAEVKWPQAVCAPRCLLLASDCRTAPAPGAGTEALATCKGPVSFNASIPSPEASIGRGSCVRAAAGAASRARGGICLACSPTPASPCLGTLTAGPCLPLPLRPPPPHPPCSTAATTQRASAWTRPPPPATRAQGPS